MQQDLPVLVGLGKRPAPGGLLLEAAIDGRLEGLAGIEHQVGGADQLTEGAVAADPGMRATLKAQPFSAVIGECGLEGECHATRLAQSCDISV